MTVALSLGMRYLATIREGTAQQAFWCTALCFSFLLETNASDVGIMKRNKKAISGACTVSTIKTATQAKSIMNQYDIKAPTASTDELISIGNGLAQISALAGGVFSPVMDSKFNFRVGTGHSRYDGHAHGDHQISMNRCSSGGTNCNSNNLPHLMHELGHKLGHAKMPNGSRYYDAYNKAVTGCRHTRYAGKIRRGTRNEEFAEAFTAFITNPDLLLASGPECIKAYDFFAKQAFPRYGQMASCDRSRIDALRGMSGGGRDLAALGPMRERARLLSQQGAERRPKASSFLRSDQYGVTPIKPIQGQFRRKAGRQ